LAGEKYTKNYHFCLSKSEFWDLQANSRLSTNMRKNNFSAFYKYPSFCVHWLHSLQEVVGVQNVVMYKTRGTSGPSILNIAHLHCPILAFRSSIHKCRVLIAVTFCPHDIFDILSCFSYLYFCNCFIVHNFGCKPSPFHIHSWHNLVFAPSSISFIFSV